MKRFQAILIPLLLAGSLAAQPPALSDFHEQFRYHPSHIEQQVIIDGQLTDSCWQHAEKVTDFFLKFPTDEGRPAKATDAYVCYDDRNLYVAFVCYDNGEAIVQSIKRDIGYKDNEAVGIVLDPLNQHTSGFVFVVNAFNAQSEDQISQMQDNDLPWNWNNKWFSATRRYPDRWVAEMSIPFKTLRYPAGNTEWGVNFLRVDMNHNQLSEWTHVPRNFKAYNLGYTGALIWDQAPPEPGRNIVMQPYITASYESDIENGKAGSFKANGGLDSKFTLNSSINLDLTLNPDFSQVEVDQQVTNLTRYDIFLPEKRTFFLENADIFGEFGIPQLITPFYSRRIGLDKDGNRIPILGGLRLSGNLGKSTRFGVMDMQTGTKEDYASENYAAIAVHQNVLARSVLKVYFLNRQSFAGSAQKQADPLEAWGRNAGFSFDFINKEGTWNGWVAYHHSFKPEIRRDNQFAEAGFAYAGRNFNNVFDLATVGTNYYTDMGYVQRIENYDALRDTSIRVGFKHIYENAMYRFFPAASSPVARYTITSDNYLVFNPDNSLNERDHNLEFQVEWKNRASLKASLNTNELNLLFPISFTDDIPLPAANYHYSQIGVKYHSDTRKQFSFDMQANTGGFYSGRIRMLGGGITFRSRPHINLILQAEYDHLDFPAPYGRGELFLISPRIEINFSTEISWTTFLQYNTQDNNYNINSRFQYRFRPMSDFFLVYTDNYFTTPFLKNKNRALVLKCNYWLNL